jgi:hypothetical protein
MRSGSWCWPSCAGCLTHPPRFFAQICACIGVTWLAFSYVTLISTTRNGRIKELANGFLPDLQNHVSRYQTKRRVESCLPRCCLVYITAKRTPPTESDLGIIPNQPASTVVKMPGLGYPNELSLLSQAVLDYSRATRFHLLFWLLTQCSCWLDCPLSLLILTCPFFIMDELSCQDRGYWYTAVMTYWPWWSVCRRCWQGIIEMRKHLNLVRVR